MGKSPASFGPRNDIDSEFACLDAVMGKPREVCFIDVDDAGTRRRRPNRSRRSPNDAALDGLVRAARSDLVARELEEWERETTTASDDVFDGEFVIVEELLPPARALPASGPGSAAKRARGSAKRPPRRGSATRVHQPAIDWDAVAMTVEHLETDPDAIPMAIGPAGYKPRECASDSPVWGAEYLAALGDAMERASLEAGDDESEYRRLLRIYFEQNPRFPEWRDVETRCVRDFRDRRPKEKRKRTSGTMETKHAVRGLEYGSAEHLDRLTLAGRAAYWRRQYKRTGSEFALRQAQAAEAEQRARKRRGAGVRTHRAA